LGDVVIRKENLSDSRPNPVVKQEFLKSNRVRVFYLSVLFGLVEIGTQPLSYSIIAGVWAMLSSVRKTFPISKPG
jgi:hypothetical protein